MLQKSPGFFGERRFNAAPPIQLSEADRWKLAEQQLRHHGIIDTEERYHLTNQIIQSLIKDFVIDQLIFKYQVIS